MPLKTNTQVPDVEERGHDEYGISAANSLR